MNKKFTITILAVISGIIILVLGMFFYYSMYLSSLQNKSETTKTENTNLLPTFSENNFQGENSDENLQESQTTGDFSSTLDNLENSGEGELLSELKVKTLEEEPVSSFVVIQASTTPKIKYILQNSGAIIEYDIKEKTKTTLKTLDLLPVENSFFSKDGNYLIAQKEQNGEIVSSLINLNSSTTTQTSLEKNIASVDFFKNSKSLVYGIKKADSFVVKVFDFKTLKSKEIAVLQLTEWLLETTKENTIRATFKATAGEDGISIIINPSSGVSKLGSRPIIGLATKEIDSSKYYLLSSGSFGRNELLFINKTSGDLFSLRENTFLEKCSFELLKSGVVCAVPKKLNDQKNYPDYWYQNRLHTEDSLVYKLLNSTSTKLLYSFKDFPVSVIYPSISSSGIFFQDSKNKKLFSLER